MSKKMIKAIALCFGYVESTSLSWLIFQAERKTPGSYKEAFHSLTEYLFSKYKADNPNEFNSFVPSRDCCKKSLEQNNASEPVNFCSVCGEKFIPHAKFYPENFWSFLHDIKTGTINGYGAHDCVEDPYGWEPWSFKFSIPNKQILVVPQNAEELLTIALSELHPDISDEWENNLSDDENYLVRAYRKLLKDGIYE